MRSLDAGNLTQSPPFYGAIGVDQTAFAIQQTDKLRHHVAADCHCCLAFSMISTSIASPFECQRARRPEFGIQLDISSNS